MYIQKHIFLKICLSTFSIVPRYNCHIEKKLQGNMIIMRSFKNIAVDQYFLFYMYSLFSCLSESECLMLFKFGEIESVFNVMCSVWYVWHFLSCPSFWYKFREMMWLYFLNKSKYCYCFSFHDNKKRLTDNESRGERYQ